jgi:hypothetical protein
MSDYSNSDAEPSGFAIVALFLFGNLTIRRAFNLLLHLTLTWRD